jgi:hypothetical protein
VDVLIPPDAHPRDILDDVACLADFLADAVPWWLENPDKAPPSPSAVQGFYVASTMLGAMVREASRRMRPRQKAA